MTKVKSKTERKLRKLPAFLTTEEVDRHFAVISSPRDSVMLRVCYYMGLRVGELVKLAPADFNLKERVLTIKAENAKRKKERRIPIPKSFIGTLKQYLGMVGKDIELFPISTARVWQLVKIYAKKACINKTVSPHTLRHSYATRLYAGTHQIELVQACLGHADIQTTMIYTHLDDSTKRKGVDEAF